LILNFEAYLSQATPAWQGWITRDQISSMVAVASGTLTPSEASEVGKLIDG
jgi:hypothetical protein